MKGFIDLRKGHLFALDTVRTNSAVWLCLSTLLEASIMAVGKTEKLLSHRGLAAVLHAQATWLHNVTLKGLTLR